MNRGVVGLILSTHKYVPFNEIRRYAGHSKFANRKHIKQATDQARALLFQQYRKRMAVAIAEGGSANPNENSKLAAIIEHAKRSNMPIAAINNFLQKKCSDDVDMGYVEIRGPGQTALVIQCQVINFNAFKLDLNHIMKKFRCKADPLVKNQFVHKGVICAEKDCHLDQATEDAINASLEDVEEAESDGRKIFVFNCRPPHLENATNKLLALDYTILSAEEEFIPHRVVTLSEENLNLIDRFCERLFKEYGEQIVKIHDNIDVSDDTSQPK